MKFSAFAVLLTVVTLGSGADPNLDKCAWGESYWCSDLRVAKSCGAIEHCKTTVWKNQQLPQDTSDVCQFCKTIIDDVHKFITDKKTEVEIAQFLSSACQIIPDKTKASECKKLVEEYAPVVIEMIVSELSPQVVCSLLKLCTGFEDHMKHYTAPSSNELHRVSLTKEGTAEATQICNDCKKFFGDIRDMITSKETEAEIEKFIDDQICTMFGGFQQQCVDLVKQYVPVVMKYIASLYDPNMICQTLGFCQQSGEYADKLRQWPLYDYFKNVKSAESCILCKTIIGEIQSLLRNKNVQDDIMNFLENDVCGHLGSAKNDCISLIKRYAPNAFELLATLLDPNSRCTNLGFCSGESNVVPSRDEDIVRSATPKKKKVPTATLR